MNLIQTQFIRMIIPVMMIYSLSEWCSTAELNLYCVILFHTILYFHILQKYWDSRSHTAVKLAFCVFHYVLALFCGAIFCAMFEDNNISIAVVSMILIYINIYFFNGEHTANKERDIENELRTLKILLIIFTITVIITVIYLLLLNIIDEKYRNIIISIYFLPLFVSVIYIFRVFLFVTFEMNFHILNQVYHFLNQVYHFLNTDLLCYFLMLQLKDKNTLHAPKSLCCDSDSITLMNLYAENIQTVQQANLIKMLLLPYCQLGLLSTCAKRELVYFISMYKVLYLSVISTFHTLCKFMTYVIIFVVFSSVFAVIVFLIIHLMHQKIASAFENIYVVGKKQEYWFDKTVNKETIIYRYLGEDVEFTCLLDEPKSFLLQFGIHSKQAYLKHNGTIIASSISNLTDGEYLNTLRIELLEEEDMGVYECLLDHNITFYGQILGITLSQNYTYNVTYSFEKYVLKMIPKHVESYFVPRGKFLRLNVFSDLFIDEESDIRIKYTVNSIDIHDICALDIMSCSPIAYLYKRHEFFQERLIVHPIINHSNRRAIFIQIQSCVCGDMYGQHEITYYREYYNTSSRKTQVNEIMLPLKLMVYPSENYLNQDDNMFEKYSGSMLFRIFNETDEIKIPFIFASEIRVNCFKLGYYLFSLLVCVLLWALQKSFSLYCRYIITPVTNICLLGHDRFPPLKIEHRKNILEIKNSECDLVYDVYISYYTEDSDYAERIVLKVLKYVEENLKLRACFPDRDLAFQAGVEILHLYAKATQSSKKFVVVLSQHYVEDDECNKLQLLRCILPLLRETGRILRDLLIIKIDNVEIPEQIKWDPLITIVNCSVIDEDQYLKHKLWKFLRE